MPPDVSNSLKSTTVEETRLRNYREQLERKNELEIDDLQARHGDEIKHVNESYADTQGKLQQDYDLAISQEAERLEDKLHETRIKNDERVATEKRMGDQEVEKLKSQNQQRIEEYKKTAEAQLDSLRKQFQASSDMLHDQARKSARADEAMKGARQRDRNST